jgi:Na+/pantothenate symporter
MPVGILADKRLYGRVHFIFYNGLTIRRRFPSNSGTIKSNPALIIAETFFLFAYWRLAFIEEIVPCLLFNLLVFRLLRAARNCGN